MNGAIMALRETTRMTSAQFVALPETNLPMELLDGEVIMTAAPTNAHQDLLFMLAKLIDGVAAKGRVKIAPLDVTLSPRDVVQPDIFWISSRNPHCKLAEDGTWHGPPDLIVEVLSPGSMRRDKVNKFRLYQRHGVREYWIVEPLERYIEVWRLAKGRYQHQGVYGPTEIFESAALGSPIDLNRVFVD
jgi:Uma2 family endonuclease